MDSLITALAAAPAASRQLDSLIAAHLGFDGWTPEEWAKVVADPEMILPSIPKAPRYTASLDAALALVPDGVSWQVTARVKEDGDFFADVDIQHECRSAATPALALCIAALRAMAPPR